ncbi:Cyanobacterial aminoacyl-tRNA synthetase [Macleaya cordata]|uniref:Cyanobacterial aminoacyl-tRNA synthetase n=1 Tax=Macleaya cordata TaxID=56857 RepID=A0A200RC85_MACCD|nr:Cyanobacterial aminoacyl-tRNA synthetase [Macleaya cordata]
MASTTTIATLPPPLIFHGRKTLFRPLRKLLVSSIGGESSDSSSSLSIVKSFQNVWDKSEDRIALIGLGFAGVVALWASSNLVAAIDKLPIVPSTLEFIGILFSWVLPKEATVCSVSGDGRMSGNAYQFWLNLPYVGAI